MASLIQRISARVSSKKHTPTTTTTNARNTTEPLICDCNLKHHPNKPINVLQDPHFHPAHPDFDEEATGWALFTLPLKDLHSHASSIADEGAKVTVEIPLYEHQGRYLRGFQKVYAFSDQYVLAVVIETTAQEDGRWIFKDREHMEVRRCDLRILPRSKAKAAATEVENGKLVREVIQLGEPQQYWVYKGKEVGGMVDDGDGWAGEMRMDWEATTDLRRRAL